MYSVNDFHISEDDVKKYREGKNTARQSMAVQLQVQNALRNRGGNAPQANAYNGNVDGYGRTK